MYSFIRPNISTSPTVQTCTQKARSSPARFTTKRSSSLVVQANGLNDFINRISIAVQNSPLADGKKALAAAQAGNYDKDAVRSSIEKAIESNKVLVYSWSGCPFCKNAKVLLNDLNADYVAVELDQLPDGKAIRAELAAMSGRTSVPNIWINGQGIGGFNDGPGLNTLNKKGELRPLLEAAGALKV